MSKFGTQTQGGSDQALAADEHFANAKVCGFDGIIYSMSAYIKNAAVGEEFRLNIYTDSASAPNVLIAQTGMLEGTGVDGWVTAELARPIAVTNGTTYWLCVHTDDPITLVYAAGSENTRIASDTWANPMSPWTGGSNVSRDYSIYANTLPVTSTKKWLGCKDEFFKTNTGLFDSYGAAPDTVMLSKVTALEDLTLEKVWAYVTDVWTAGMYARAVIYSDNGGVPDALLKQSDPIQGAGTEQWYSADLQSTLDVTNGTTYWIGFQADSNSTNWMECPYGWVDDLEGYYTVADTYVGGPADPCNSPADDDFTCCSMSYYAEAQEGFESESDAVQQAVMLDML